MRFDFKFDKVLALAVAALILFGVVMITSIGVPKSIALSAPGILYPNCSDASVDCYLLFKKHLIRLLIGIVGLYIAYKIPLRFWKKMAPAIYVFGVGLLFLVLILGNSFGTIANSWLTLFNTSFQPSEFAKLAAIVYLSYWFAQKRESIKTFQDGFIPFCIISGLMVGPVVLQNDFGSTLVLAMICSVIYFIAGARLRHLGLGVLIAVLAAILVVSTVDHVRERFQGFMRVNEDCLEDYCWQSQQANIAVSTGGFWGRGLTQGIQKSYWLPQASDDFIFAASAEELGFLRISVLVLLYFTIAYRGYLIAYKADNNFEKYMAMGLTTWIVFQAFINIMVNTALLPVTGITLPFVSYGGTSLIMTMAAVGILLKISVGTAYASSADWRRNRRTRSPQYGRYRRA